MKLIAERTHLLAALKAVGHLAKAKAKIPMLAFLRLRTEGDRLFLAATDHDAFAEAEIPADVARQGSICVDAATLLKLVNDFAEGAQVSLDANDKLATLKAGRSRYQLHVLAANDFPSMFEPNGSIAKFMLMPEEARRLLDLPRSAAAKGRADLYYLEGIYLHASEDGATLWSAACDTHVLIVADVDAPEGAQDLPRKVEADDTRAARPRGLMLPLDSVAHILRLGEVPLEIHAGENVVAVRAAASGVKLHYVTRLIENIFPPYERIVPAAEGTCLTVAGDLFAAALRRLSSVAGSEERAVGVEWGEEGDLSLWLDNHAEGIYGAESIPIVACTGPGRIGIRPALALKAMDALGGGNIEIWSTTELKPVRLRSIADPGLIAVVWVARLTRRPEHGALFGEGEAA
ncbi:hypothetical protein [Ancylobacter sp. FA202]|uniref:DNA polymerase III subunit beta n=1 Tax=Ancylobacter sp. FA202 TaxID=1111106 RepID=UPI0003823655|nr:hypothetical protein [Ancylobacter sp. FA202]